MTDKMKSHLESASILLRAFLDTQYELVLSGGTQGERCKHCHAWRQIVILPGEVVEFHVYGATGKDRTEHDLDCPVEKTRAWLLWYEAFLKGRV